MAGRKPEVSQPTPPSDADPGQTCPEIPQPASTADVQPEPIRTAAAGLLMPLGTGGNKASRCCATYEEAAPGHCGTVSF